MTKNHPLLTEENLRYWYWIQDPKYSLQDISNETGASESTVHRFMVKHNIERRTLRNASNKMKYLYTITPLGKKIISKELG